MKTPLSWYRARVDASLNRQDPFAESRKRMAARRAADPEYDAQMTEIFAKVAAWKLTPEGKAHTAQGARIRREERSRRRSNGFLASSFRLGKRLFGWW